MKSKSVWVVAGLAAVGVAALALARPKAKQDEQPESPLGPVEFDGYFEWFTPAATTGFGVGAITVGSALSMDELRVTFRGHAKSPSGIEVRLQVLARVNGETVRESGASYTLSPGEAVAFGGLPVSVYGADPPGPVAIVAELRTTRGQFLGQVVANQVDGHVITVRP